MSTPRVLAIKAKSLIAVFPIVAIVGPRQSGKTTLIRHSFPTFKYFNLEDLDVRRIAMEDPRGFLRNIGDKGIIDEVQQVPELFSYIQTYVDNNDVKLILSGSQNFNLMESISQSLAGRVALLTLLPFSMEEVPLNNDINTQIFNGQYPRVHHDGIHPTDYYPNYIRTYIERDVRQIQEIENLSSFRKFIELCAGRIGKELNFSSLANDADISPNTAKSWISILETSYIIHLLRPYHKNYNKRIIKSPKLYFHDTGVACSLLGLESSGQLQSFHMRGDLFENFVINEFLKYDLNRGKEPKYFFWREKNKHEIDLILPRLDHTVAFEIKSSQTIHDRFYKHLHYFDQLENNPKSERYVIYGGNDSFTATQKKYLSWRNMLSVLKK